MTDLPPKQNDAPSNWIEAYQDWLFVMEIPSASAAAQSGFAAGYSYGRLRPISNPAQDPQWVKVNLNDYIRVKLTIEGFTIHEAYWTPFSAGKYKPPSVDEEGYTRFQIHEFANVFGSHLSMGFAPCVAMDVLIEVKPSR